MTDLKLSRGYRNKNPGNVEYNPSVTWQGQLGREEGGGGRFCRFNTHENGIRAMAMILATYQDKYGLMTIRQMVSRWAPPDPHPKTGKVENFTEGYVNRVAKELCVAPYVEVRFRLFPTIHWAMVKAMIGVELGDILNDGDATVLPYTDEQIKVGVRRARMAKWGLADL